MPLIHFFKQVAVLMALLFQVLQAADKPNILFFLVDDMGSQDTSVPFYFKDGKEVVTKTNKIYKTPNMERLAQNGRRFSNAYAYSVCSPTRVSIMTGLSCVRHGVTTWTHPVTDEEDTGRFKNKTMQSAEWNKSGVPANVPTLTRLMKEAGYLNLFAGKAHFGPNNTKNGNPLNLYFDVNIAGHGAGGPGSYSGKENFGKGQWHVPGLEKYHGTDTHLSEALTIEMNAVISKAVKRKQPFFAYMSHYAVHAPFQLDTRFERNYPNLKGHDKAYATLVEGMDKSLGDMMAHLDKLGVAEDTLVVFYSDNGGARMLAHNHPYKGMKGWRSEGGHRVPLLVAWAKPNPENKFQQRYPIAARSHDETMVSCLDIMPTFLDIADAKIPEGLDGQSFLAQIKGKKSGRIPEFLTHFPHGRHNNNMFTSYRYDQWRIIYSYIPKKWELYDLKSDPGEAKNLIHSHPDKARELAKRMLTKLEAQGANFPKSIKDGKPIKPVMP